MKKLFLLILTALMLFVVGCNKNDEIIEIKLEAEPTIQETQLSKEKEQEIKTNLEICKANFKGRFGQKVDGNWNEDLQCMRVPITDMAIPSIHDTGIFFITCDDKAVLSVAAYNQEQDKHYPVILYEDKSFMCEEFFGESNTLHQKWQYIKVDKIDTKTLSNIRFTF